MNTSTARGLLCVGLALALMLGQLIIDGHGMPMLLLGTLALWGAGIPLLRQAWRAYKASRPVMTGRHR